MIKRWLIGRPNRGRNVANVAMLVIAIATTLNSLLWNGMGMLMIQVILLLATIVLLPMYTMGSKN